MRFARRSILKRRCRSPDGRLLVPRARRAAVRARPATAASAAWLEVNGYQRLPVLTSMRWPCEIASAIGRKSASVALFQPAERSADRSGAIT